MIVDAHHHFWDPARRDYPWMGDELAAIRRRFGPDELRPLVRANKIDRTVVVQTVSSVGETSEFLETAEATDFVAGVVGWVDLTDPNVTETISALRKGFPEGLLVGIRHQVHDEADPRWLLREEVVRGIRAVGEADLVYDLLVRARELPAALQLVRQLPEVTFVIDHAGKPRIAAGPRDIEWEQAMAPLADCPNVSCKLSGLVTEARWDSWTPRDLEPYVKRVVDWFGPTRCMVGSDWPVCLLASTYDGVLEAMREAVSDLSPSENEAVFGGNAAR
ncbi:MAG: amidohydrolase, partial [Chloroflexi bacterium]